MNTEEIVTQEVSKDKPFFDDDEEGYNFNEDNSYNMNQINEPVIYYEWFADSTTSSHVTNKHDTFITFEPLYNTSVVGVGQIKAKVEGKGTVELLTQYNNKTYILRLQNVLYIPTNRNNLFSLGKWDAAGGKYVGAGRKITLENKQSKQLQQDQRLLTIYTN